MGAPKTVKSFLKKCLEIAQTTRDDLKGIENLTEDEYVVLGDIRAEVQNNLGDSKELLKKHKLEDKW